MPVNFFLLFNWGIICKTCTCFKCKAQWVTAKYSLLTWLTFFVFLLILGAVYECFLLSLTCFCVDPNKKILKHYLEPLTIRRIHIYGISCRWGPPARNHCAELFFRPPPRKNNLSNSLGIPGSAPALLWVAQWGVASSLVSQSPYLWNGNVREGSRRELN